MAYASIEEMVKLIGTDTYTVTVPGGSVSDQDTAATLALEDASGLADTYIARWIPLPVGTPPALRDAVVWIATYNLAGDKWTEHMRARYDDAMRWLRDVSAGKASLGVLSTPSASGGSARLCAPEREMTRSRLAGVL